MENSSVGRPTTEEVKGPAVATTSILAEEFRRAGDARRQEGGGLDKRVRALGRGRGRGRDGGLTDVEGVLLHGLVHVSGGVAAWRRRGRLVRREEGTETGRANLSNLPGPRWLVSGIPALEFIILTSYQFMICLEAKYF